MSPIKWRLAIALHDSYHHCPHAVSTSFFISCLFLHLLFCNCFLIEHKIVAVSSATRQFSHYSAVLAARILHFCVNVLAQPGPGCILESAAVNAYTCEYLDWRLQNACSCVQMGAWLKTIAILNAPLLKKLIPLALVKLRQFQPVFVHPRLIYKSFWDHFDGAFCWQGSIILRFDASGRDFETEEILLHSKPTQCGSNWWQPSPYNASLTFHPCEAYLVTFWLISAKLPSFKWHYHVQECGVLSITIQDEMDIRFVLAQFDHGSAYSEVGWGVCSTLTSEMPLFPVVLAISSVSGICYLTTSVIGGHGSS